MVPEVDLGTFAAAHSEGALVLDVREPVEYAAAHVPRALLIPMTQIHARINDVPRGERVYVICASGNRSYTAAEWLRNHGVDAVSVAGGTSGWSAQGRPIVRGSEPDDSAA